MKLDLIILLNLLILSCVTYGEVKMVVLAGFWGLLARLIFGYLTGWNKRVGDIKQNPPKWYFQPWKK